MKTKLDQNFLVLGDIHGEFDQFVNAVRYAEKHDLLIISLGDVIDYGQKPFESVSLMLDLINSGYAIMIKGNHELKFEKYLNQRARGDIKVKVKGGLEVTVNLLNALDSTKRVKVFDEFQELMSLSSLSLQDETTKSVFVHAGVHADYWRDTRHGPVKNTMMFGEVKGFKDDGMPIRSYSWVQDIPAGYTVFIGHDIIGDQPVFTKNANGGSVHMIDTGAGKNGTLSGVHVNIDAPNEFRYLNFQGA